MGIPIVPLKKKIQLKSSHYEMFWKHFLIVVLLPGACRWWWSINEKHFKNTLSVSHQILMDNASVHHTHHPNGASVYSFNTVCWYEADQKSSSSPQQKDQAVEKSTTDQCDSSFSYTQWNLSIVKTPSIIAQCLSMPRKNNGIDLKCLSMPHNKPILSKTLIGMTYVQRPIYFRNRPGS